MKRREFMKRHEIMKRRDFMKKTSRAAVSASLIGTAARWAVANDRVRLAGIGMGGRGGDLLQEALKIEGVELVAVCDPDRQRSEQRAAEAEKLSGKRPKALTDLREVTADKEIDAVTITTCNHWHALAAIWAMQGGKHVYVEKPVSHNLFEGRQMVNASRKYNRMTQGGTQRRSYGLWQRAIQALHEGYIGEVYMARALVYNPRDSIGVKPIENPPPELDWNLWLGPAPEQPYHANLVHYNWHWFWDFGNGELGNNGSHFLDVARWGLGKGLPQKVESVGGRFGYEDQAQTPNTQTVLFQYDDGVILTCEIRGRYTHDESGLRYGVIYYGSEGYMAVSDEGIKTAMGKDGKPGPELTYGSNQDHMKNFIDAVREGKREMLHAEIEETYLSCALCCLGNIAYRLGRSLRFDSNNERFPGDEEADRMLSRDYREPFLVPKEV